MSFQLIVFYLLLLDSIVVNLLAWFDGKWFAKNFRTFSRYFPIAKGWAALYFLLVLWIGFLTLT